MALYLGETQIFGVATGDAATQENLDAELSTQDDLITQIATALEGKTGGSSTPTYTTIETTVTLSGNQVVIPDLIGKTFFIIALQGTISTGNTLDDERIYSLVYMNKNFYSTYPGLFGTKLSFLLPLDSTCSFDSETGTIDLSSNSNYIGFVGYPYLIYAC